MPKYKSYKSVSLSEPIVCSFTIGSESCSYDLELLDSNLNTITSLSVSSDYDFVEGSNSNHILLSEDNQLSELDFPSIPDKSKAIIISNYGNELFGNKITIVKKSSLAALSSDYKTNENGDIILNDNSYCPVIIYDDNGKKAYTEYHFNNNEAFTDGAALFVNTYNTDNV